MTVVCFSVVIDHIPFFLRYFFHSIAHCLLTASTWVTVVYAAKRGTGTWISWKFTSTSGRIIINSMSFRVAIPHVPKKYYVRNSRRTRP